MTTWTNVANGGVYIALLEHIFYTQNWTKLLNVRREEPTLFEDMLRWCYENYVNKVDTQTFYIQVYNILKK